MKPLYIQIDPKKCRKCGRCPAQEVCPTQAIIRRGQDNTPIINPGQCIGCLECVEVCPFDAIKQWS